MLTIVIASLLAYLLGSVSSAVITCKLLRLPDPRLQGSKNPGATNVLRLGGKKAALITLAGDILKGVIPVVLASWYGLPILGLAWVGLAAFIGHLYPIFFGFKGGKGVATALGVFIALSPLLGGLLIITWLGIALIFRYSSLAALVTAVLGPFYAWFITNPTVTCLATIMSIILLMRHKQNIVKLYRGEESKIGKKNYS